MTLAKQLRKAALFMHRDRPRGSCGALCGANVDDFFDVRDRYCELFKPKLTTYPCGYWGDHWGKDSHKCRVLALCFAAAMAETGDL